MNTATQNSPGRTETLKARKTHLSSLLKLMGSRWGKSTAIQNLTATRSKQS